MIKVGDKIRWDPQRDRMQAQISSCETGVIDGILPIGFKHIDDRVPQATVSKIHSIFITLDDKVRTAISLNLVVEINGIRRPDLTKDEVARLWGD